MDNLHGRNDTADDHEKRSPAELFRTFHYPEVKDLGKHFLTLISATLVLSVTFAEKIVGLDARRTPAFWLLALCWVLLVAALVACGWGLFRIYLAAEKSAGSIIYDYEGDFRDLARKSYFWLDCAALMFGGALLLLAASGVARFLQT